MKRIISIILCVVIMCCGLAGCNKESEITENSSKTTENSSEIVKNKIETMPATDITNIINKINEQCDYKLSSSDILPIDKYGKTFSLTVNLYYGKREYSTEQQRQDIFDEFLVDYKKVEDAFSKYEDLYTINVMCDDYFTMNNSKDFSKTKTAFSQEKSLYAFNGFAIDKSFDNIIKKYFNQSQAEEDVNIVASEELVNKIDNDQLAAQSLYKNKTIQVSGKVVGISSYSDLTGYYFVNTLESGKTRIVCWFEGQANHASVGDKITIQGYCRTVEESTEITECKIMDE